MNVTERLEGFLGDDALVIVEKSTSAAAYVVIYEEGKEDRRLGERLVQGERQLSARELDSLRSALLEESTYSWDGVTRHFDFPLSAFEVKSDTGSCVFFLDESGGKIRVYFAGESRVQDCSKSSEGFVRLCELSRGSTG